MCGGHAEGAQRGMEWGTMEWLLGVWRLHRVCVEGVSRACGGCVEGYRMVARYIEHMWGCTESTQKGIEWLLCAQRGPMEWLLGPWRVCGGHKEGGWRGIEWLLGV